MGSLNSSAHSKEHTFLFSPGGRTNFVGPFVEKLFWFLLLTQMTTVSEVLLMLNKDFVKWVIAALVFAFPIGWYAMNKWLENFAYKTTLSWWIFALAGALALGIALRS